MITGAFDVIPDPVYVQKDLLAGVDDQHEGFEQADEEKPVEDVLLGVHLDYGRLFDDLVEDCVDWDHYHHQQHEADEGEGQVDQVYHAREVVDELDHSDYHKERYWDHYFFGAHCSQEDLHWFFLPAVETIVGYEHHQNEAQVGMTVPIHASWG